MPSEGHLARRAFALAVFIAAASACSTTLRTRAASPTPASAPTAAADEADGEDDADDEASGEEQAEAAGAPEREPATAGPCPASMALVEQGERRFCVDKYEASLVEVTADGTEQPFAHYLPVDGHDVRAVSQPGVFPQGFISEVQAQDACAASGKRLCTHEEWKTACMGPSRTTFPYGDARRPGTCHDTGKSAVIAVFGAKAVAASTPFVAPATKTTGKRAHVTKGRAAQATRSRASAAKSSAGKHAARGSSSKKHRSSTADGVGRVARRTGKKSARPVSVDPGVWARLNDPALGQVEGALSRTGDHGECVNGFGVFDMVGNLHEWVATDATLAHGTFAGGYYLDTALNGDGCNYRTVAHAHDYHDYSTGFRCCAEPR